MVFPWISYRHLETVIDNLVKSSFDIRCDSFDEAATCCWQVFCRTTELALMQGTNTYREPRIS